MYTFSSKLKTFSIALIILGALGMGYGFFTAPKTTDDVKEMMQHAEDTHGTTTDHATETSHEVASSEHKSEADSDESHADEEAHLEHALTQAQNRPWAATYVAMLFFLLISVCFLNLSLFEK